MIDRRTTIEKTADLLSETQVVDNSKPESLRRELRGSLASPFSTQLNLDVAPEWWVVRLNPKQVNSISTITFETGKIVTINQYVQLGFERFLIPGDYGRYLTLTESGTPGNTVDYEIWAIAGIDPSII